MKYPPDSLKTDESTVAAPSSDASGILTRRRFMTYVTASASSLALQACGGAGGVAAPASTQLLSTVGTGGEAASSAAMTLVPGALAGFQLTSPGGGVDLPFSIGYVFRKGDVPAGASVTGSLAGMQVVGKNTWPDGSLKFATISGLATLAAGAPLTVTLGIGVMTSAVALTTQDLRGTGVTASVSAGSFGTASWADLDWAEPFMTWIGGAQMSSWIYRKPLGSDPHLMAWLEVRLYRGGTVEVLPWVENGFLNVPAPTNKNAMFAFTLGSTQRFEGSINLPNHCRTVLISGSGLSHWLGQDPQVTPNHDKAYLQSTGLVPTYRAAVPSTAAVWSRLVTSYSPLQKGNYTDPMGGAGYQSAIGLLPEWDVLYLASNDLRAYAGVILNAYSAGRYPIHFRDETTSRPLKFSSYPYLVVKGGPSSGIPGTGGSTKGVYTPTASGTVPAIWDLPHHPSVGFTAYLLTGKFYFMEEVQFSATLNFMKNSDNKRMYSDGVFQTDAGANQTRGAAWSIRTLAQAACITPDNDAPLRAEFIASLAANVDFYHAKYIAQPNNPQGFVAPYSNYPNSTGIYSEAAWMQDFFTAASGYAIDLAIPMAPASVTRLTAFFAWKAQSIIGRLGGIAPNEFLYCDAAVYTVAVAPTGAADFVTGAGPWFANWGEIYAATLGRNNPGVAGGLRGAYYPGATSYWGNLQPAIAYAVQHNVPGALAAYTRMTTAPNWGDIVKNWNLEPVWSVMPNPFAIPVQPQPENPTNPQLPAWVPPAGYFADVPMLNNPEDITPPIYQSYVNDSYIMNNPFTLWGGSAILRDYSDLGAQVYYSGGHESSFTRANVQFSLICDFSTLRWSTANLPVAANIANTFIKGLAADGTPYNPHTYLGLQEMPAAWGGGPKGTLASFFWSGATGAWNPDLSTRIENRINLLDVSQPQMGYSQLATQQPQNVDPTKIRFSATTQGGAYPITEIDLARKGWWVATNGSVNYLLFVDKSGLITQYPALGGNLINAALALCAPLNLLVAVDGGYSVGQYAGNGHRTLHIRNLTTGAVTKSLTLGTVPSLVNGYDGSVATFHRPDVMGLQWVDELGCIVGLDQSTVPPTVVMLTPPASNPATASWTWSTVPLQHWPQDASGQGTLQGALNSIWSKFRWVPSLQAFVYGTAKNRKPQVIKLN